MGKTKEKPEPEFLNAEEAAEFIRMSYSEFRKRAPEFPRYAISERRYVYWRPELVEWVLSQREANANEQEPTVTHNSRVHEARKNNDRLIYGRQRTL